MYFILAWRNIWRNVRRTAVIMTAIIIGVWAMIFLGAIMRGMVNAMVENNISTLTGHIQVHKKGYRNDPVVENTMTDPDEVREALKKALPSKGFWTERVRVGAVASNARHSTGLTLVGIDPATEQEISFFRPEAVTEGEYLSPDDEYGIVIGEALADKMETRLGRKLVLMSQDTTKEISSRAFRIVGIFQSEMEATEKAYAFVNIPVAQEMLKIGDGISEISISVGHHNAAAGMTADIKSVLPATYDVHDWRELRPFIDAYLEIFDAFGYIWYLVVFIAMGFGIVNTTLMAVFERMREFGLLKALGMGPWWIIRSVLTESLLLLIMGTAIGNILGFLSIWALSGTGIDLTAVAAGAEYANISRIIYPAVSSKDVTVANLVVLVLGLVVSVYPAIKAARFTPVEAMAQN